MNTPETPATPELPDGLTVLELRAENVKKVRVVRIAPRSPAGMVPVRGKNGAGKSSTLDCIPLALCGKGAQPTLPIRRGATSARDTIKLQDRNGRHVLTIERTWTGAGTYLKVLLPDGRSVPSPQTFLDRITQTDLAFDPSSFVTLAPQEQMRMLLDALRLPEDPRAFDTQRTALEEERRGVNREIKTLKVKLDTLPTDDGVPDEEVSVAALMDEVERLTRTRDEHQKLRAQAEELETSATRLTESLATARRSAEETAARIVTLEPQLMTAAETLERGRAQVLALEERVARLRAELTTAETELRDEERAVRDAERATETLDREHKDARAVLTTTAAAIARDEATLASTADLRARCREVLPTLVEPDVEGAKGRVRTAEATNARVRVATERRQTVAAVAGKDAEATALTQRIERLEERKREVLERAAFPVPGLGFEFLAGDYVITMHGIPLDQCADSVKIRVGMALAMALNPKLSVVLIRNGSLLDADSLAIVSEMAEAGGAQVWCELVDDAGGDGWIMIDGESKECSAHDVSVEQRTPDKGGTR